MAEPEPFLGAPMSPVQRRDLWDLWRGAPACNDDKKREKCLEIGLDCDEFCICVIFEGCGCGATFWCKEKGGHLDNGCNCHVPTGGGGTSRRRRSVSECAPGLSACPVDTPTGGSRSSKVECLDTQSSIDSCGGCATEGRGTDCTSLPGVMDVSCQLGECVVHSCDKGFAVENGTMCVEVEEGGSKGFVLGALKGAEKFWGL